MLRPQDAPREDAPVRPDLCPVTHGHFDGLKPSRVHPVEMDETLDWHGLRLTTFEWDHRIVNTTAMFAARPEAKAMLSDLYFSNPYAARRRGFTVTLEDGGRVTNHCEGFNDQTRMAQVRRVAERDRPDVVVAGAQLDYPAQVAEANFIGLAARPPRDFVAAVRAAAPAVHIETAEPGRHIAL